MSSKKKLSVKKVRQPLKCKKNVIHANKFIQNSPKNNRRSYSSVIKDERKAAGTTSLKPTEISLLSSSRQSKTLQSENIITGKFLRNKHAHYKLSDSFEIDLLCNKTLALQKLPKRSLRSSKLNQTPQLVNSTNNNKNISELQKKKCNVYETCVLSKKSIVHPKSLNKRLLSSASQKSVQPKSIIVTYENTLKDVNSIKQCYVKIDDLSIKSQAVPLQSSNRNLRSSIGQNISSNSKDIHKTDENHTKSKKDKSSSVKKEALCKTPLTSVKTSERRLRSSSRQSITSKSRDITTSKRKSHRLQELNESLFTPSYFSESLTQPVKTPNKAARGPKTSIILRSSLASGKKIDLQEPKGDERSSYGRLKINTPIVKKLHRKPSVRSKKQVTAKSISEHIPVDDLALSFVFPPRKAKSEGYKLPGKNTLKRKRLIMSEIRKADENYEDDIYEAKRFDHFKDIFPDTSESEVSWGPTTTPKLGLSTPIVRNKSTPVFKDCFSPAGYAISRKVAEECLFKNKKRKSATPIVTPIVPEKKKLEFNKVLEEASIMQKEFEKLTEEKSDEEDLYFDDD